MVGEGAVEFEGHAMVEVDGHVVGACDSSEGAFGAESDGIDCFAVAADFAYRGCGVE